MLWQILFLEMSNNDCREDKSFLLITSFHFKNCIDTLQNNLGYLYCKAKESSEGKTFCHIDFFKLEILWLSLSLALRCINNPQSWKSRSRDRSLRHKSKSLASCSMSKFSGTEHCGCQNHQMKRESSFSPIGKVGRNQNQEKLSQNHTFLLLYYYCYCY